MSNDGQELVDEWVVQIEGRLENPYNSHATRRPSMDGNIEKYPSIFGKWECWDDFGASFIPEHLKWICVASMTHYFGLNVRSYLLFMQKKVHVAWSHYHGVDDQLRAAECSTRFIEHLLVNSCFLIFSMILLSGEKELKDSWFEIINKDNPKGLSTKDIQNIIDFIKQDGIPTRGYMLTMNYQIPWFVVQAVYTELSNLSKLLVTPIHKIAYLSCRGFQPNPINKIDAGGILPEGGFKHLLHIFHWSRVPDGKHLLATTTNFKGIGRFHIPTATDLKLSQTVFLKNENVSVDVSYGEGRISGVMQITPWRISRHTTQLYEGLIRFERHYKGCAIPFTSYIACMAWLLKTEADVGVLRANDIIPSTSFDDKAVLRTVEELRTLIDDDLHLSNELIILEQKVMAHHKKSIYRVLGEFKNRYCSNPWIIISVIAGISLFVLTFIQTLYGMLNYYKQ